MSIGNLTTKGHPPTLVDRFGPPAGPPADTVPPAEWFWKMARVMPITGRYIYDAYGHDRNLYETAQERLRGLVRQKWLVVDRPRDAFPSRTYSVNPMFAR